MQFEVGSTSKEARRMLATASVVVVTSVVVIFPSPLPVTFSRHPFPAPLAGTSSRYFFLASFRVRPAGISSRYLFQVPLPGTFPGISSWYLFLVPGGPCWSQRENLHIDRRLPAGV